MEPIYYDGQELKKRVFNFLKNENKSIESIEIKAVNILPDLETFKNKYRLLYGREFEELEILENNKLMVSLPSNDNKVHLKGSLECLFSDSENAKEIAVPTFIPDDMSSMFADLNFIFDFRPFTHIKSIDLSNLDTSKVTNMAGMFYDCKDIVTLDLSNLDTSNVTSMYGMFENCLSIEKLDLSNFDTHNVTDMRYMFNSCIELKVLDISNFVSSSLVTIKGMFSSCLGVEVIDMAKFRLNKIKDTAYLFYNCIALNKINTIDSTILRLYNNNRKRY